MFQISNYNSHYDITGHTFVMSNSLHLFLGINELQKHTVKPNADTKTHICSAPHIYYFKHMQGKASQQAEAQAVILLHFSFHM